MAVKFKDTININGQYTLPEVDGTNGQALITDGGGNLSFSSAAIAGTADAAEATHLNVKNTSGASIAKGTPVYVTGNVGATDKLEIAPADASNSAKMPAIGVLESTLAINGEGFVVQGGLLTAITTDVIDGVSSTSNDTIYVKAGGGLTLTKPTGSTNLIQNIAKVARVHASNGSIIVSSILRTNDVPNLSTGKIWVGDSNTIESTVVHIDETNGRLGIGTNSPSIPLHVNGGTRIEGTLFVETTNNHIRLIDTDHSGNFSLGVNTNFQIRDIDNNLTPVTIQANTPNATLYLNSSGNVGIGATSPTEKLEVTGNTILDASNANLKIKAGTIGTKGDIQWTFNTDSTIYASAGIEYDNRVTDGFLIDSGYPITLDFASSYIRFSNNGSEKMRINTAGNVGIGTTSINSKVQIEQAQQISGAFSNPFIKLSNSAQTNNTGTTAIALATSTAEGYGYAISAQRGTTGADSDFIITHHDNSLTGTPRFVIDGSGNVGIGTTSPSDNLHISGTTASIRLQDSDGTDTFGRLRYTGSSVYFISRNNTSNGNFIFIGNNGTSDTEYMRIHSGGDISFRDTSNNQAFYWDASASSLGIGTTSPTNNSKLTVLHDTTGATVTTGGLVSIMDAKDMALGNGGGIRFGGIYQTGGTPNADMGYIKAYKENATSGNFSYALTFGTRASGGNPTERMRITSDGNVGIGTTPDADAELHIYRNGSASRLRIEREFNGQLDLESLNGYAQIGTLNNFPLAFKTNAQERMRIDSSGSVTATVDLRAPIFYDSDDTGFYLNPASTSLLSRLAITNDGSDTQALKITYNQTNPDLGSAFGLFIDGNFSGADNTTGDRFQGGINIDIDSSADGDASDEHKLYGVKSDVKFTGFSDTAYGIYNYIESNNDTEQTAQVAAIVNFAYHDTGASGGCNTLYGSINTAQAEDAGAINTNIAGSVNNAIIHSTRTVNVNNVYGVLCEVQIDSPNAISYGAVAGVRSIIDNNQGTTPTGTNSYLFWGDYQGTEYATNSYGIYCEGNKHYLTNTLTVTGDVQSPIFYDSANTTYYGDFANTGDSIRAAGDIVAYHSSDKRLKDNIIKIDSALDKVNAIGGYTFEWNKISHKETGKKDVGVIAQEVEEIFPEIVETRTNGYKAVNYEKLVPLLIEAVKELSEKVKILENK